MDHLKKDPENEERALLGHLKEVHKKEHEMCQVKMKKIKPTKKKDAYKVENEQNLNKLKQHFLLEKFKLKLELAQKLSKYLILSSSLL